MLNKTIADREWFNCCCIHRIISAPCRTPISEIARPEANSNKTSDREAARRVYTMLALEQMLHGKCWGERFSQILGEVNKNFLYVLKM